MARKNWREKIGAKKNGAKKLARKIVALFCSKYCIFIAE
jgi:hypothetical protein